MRTLLAVLVLALPAACALAPPAETDPDAPAERPLSARRGSDPPDYAAALHAWVAPEQVNTWIGERFEYDRARAQRLSETQRLAQGTLPIHTPEAFYAEAKGVCVDLARFAVETLRTIAPASRPRYLMLEFDPVSVQGNTLRRHWVAVFERDGRLYVFADSKRPGHIAGPYARVQDYVAEYASYRGRTIVAAREVPGYQRRAKTPQARPRGSAV